MRKSRSPSTSRCRPHADALRAAVLAILVAAQAGRASGTAPASSLVALDADLLAALADDGVQLRDLTVLFAIVNGTPRGDIMAFVEPGGSVLVEEATLRAWRINVAGLAGRDIEGRRFVSLDAIRGAKVLVHPRTMALDVTLPAALFEASEIDIVGRKLPLVTPVSSAFLNYDVFAYASRDTRYEAGLVEAGASGPYGLLLATAAANNSSIAGASGRVTRLETSWRYDDVDRARTLIAGDGVNRTGAWGRAIRYGGVQYGTNFALQPDLITYPLQAVPGVASVPSTVDVLVNGMRVATQDVPPGPFVLNNVPLVTGAGDVQVVVRDAFGQQQVITQPFYASRQLLAPGLDDYTITLGAVRNNYGIDSFDYGSPFASAYWRRGVTDRTTIELRAEGDRTTRAAGAAVDFMPGHYGVFTAGGAASAGSGSTGRLLLGGYQYQSQRFNAGFRGTWASESFRLVGDSPGPPLQRLVLANAGFGVGYDSSVGIAWAAQRYRGIGGSDSAIVSYSMRLWRDVSVSASASRTYGGASQSGFFAALIVPLDRVTSFAGDLTAVRAGGRTTTTGGATLQRTLPVGEGYGYRVRATTDDQYEAGVSYGGAYGRYEAEVGHFAGTTAFRGSIAGGIGTLGGAWFAAQPIVDSFGLVRLDDVPGVHVYQNGNLAGVTDDRGRVILTQLFAYTENRVSIEDKDVPIDVLLKDRERRVAPYYRAGVIVDFGARKLVNASIVLRLADGRPVPAGAHVRRDGIESTYPIADDGETFIPDFAYGVRYSAEWVGHSCEFSVPEPSGARESMPTLGPTVCDAVAERAR